MRNFMAGRMACRLVAALGLLNALFFVASPRPARAQAIQQNAVAGALQAALAKNIAHAQEWLDQKDFKSLAQSAGGLRLLAEMLQALSDDAIWQSTTNALIIKTDALVLAARREDSEQCNEALGAMGGAVWTVSHGGFPGGKSTTINHVPAIRALMLTMDALAADAKIALMAGNAEAAKKQAVVLSELGKLVSNSRSGQAWKTMAGDFLQATDAAAITPESDPKAVRQLFRTIAERCEACHETRGR